MPVIPVLIFIVTTVQDPELRAGQFRSIVGQFHPVRRTFTNWMTAHTIAETQRRGVPHFHFAVFLHDVLSMTV
jgi:hypothetical protein